jgi:XRE family transcriptional regulator, regulator of sulfur utilization
MPTSMDYRKKQLETLVRNIKTARAKLSYTQEKLAEEAKLSIGAIKQLESKQRFPRPETLQHIAKALKTTPDQLIQENMEIVSQDDLAQRVFEKLKNVFAPQQAPVINLQMPNTSIKPHLQSIFDKLEKIDPKKNAVFLAELESLVDDQISLSEKSQNVRRKTKRA